MKKQGYEIDKILKPLAGNVNGSPNIAEIAMRTKKHN
jgi:hypothetical protein